MLFRSGGGYLQLGAFELHEEVIEDRKRVFIADDLSRGRQEREQGWPFLLEQWMV